jgi:hypothetical protein
MNLFEPSSHSDQAREILEAQVCECFARVVCVESHPLTGDHSTRQDYSQCRVQNPPRGAGSRLRISDRLMNTSTPQHTSAESSCRSVYQLRQIRAGLPLVNKIAHGPACDQKL